MALLCYIDSEPFTISSICLDDVHLLGGDAGLNKLNTDETGEFASLTNESDVVEEPTPQRTTEHIREGAMSSTVSCSGPSSLLKEGEGISLSLFVLLSFPLIAFSIIIISYSCRCCHFLEFYFGQLICLNEG